MSLRQKLAPQVVEVLDALLDMVEEEGSARVKLSHAQAETYGRLYLGLKFMSAVESLTLLAPSDELYGWGNYARHEVRVVPLGTVEAIPLNAAPDQAKELRLQQKRGRPAWLEVRETAEIIATTKMYLIHAITAPTLVPNSTTIRLSARRTKLRYRMDDPGIAEQLGRLAFRQRGPDVWAGIINRQIEKIPDIS